jgi:hypothetical protein
MISGHFFLQQTYRMCDAYVVGAPPAVAALPEQGGEEIADGRSAQGAAVTGRSFVVVVCVHTAPRPQPAALCQGPWATVCPPQCPPGSIVWRRARPDSWASSSRTEPPSFAVASCAGAPRAGPLALVVTGPTSTPEAGPLLLASGTADGPGALTGPGASAICPSRSPEPSSAGERRRSWSASSAVWTSNSGGWW